MRPAWILSACSALLSALPVLAAARGREAPALEAGPFRIETQVHRIAAGGFPNTSGNPFKRRDATRIRVLHRGREVTVPLKNGERMERFWQAWVLDGAPRPAVVVGQTGVFLLTDEDGVLQVTTLREPDTGVATLQWLDAEAGQPGHEESLLIRDARGERQILSGGRRLLVGRDTVLDVASLAVHRFRLYDSRDALDGYHASGEPARALSPDGRQLVMIGSRYDGDYRYALIAVDHAANRAYAVPFTRSFTRFHSVWSADRAWFQHYFEWRPDPATGWRLQPRKDVEPLPWLGELIEFGGGMVDYRLRPVDARMLEVLAGFIEQSEGAVRIEPAAQDRIDLRASDDTLHLWHRAEEQQVSLYAGSGPTAASAYARIRRLGEAFNAELAQGRHQALFGSLDPAE